ncbi:hypothetical protein TNCT_361661 [Trichonephila clavata]|uniref:Uncharacterized protein n=1 Tax=Trichonephila clavata TaxID=2740835 RepID=A0A8X6KWV2_TRICU|nr:hypothetical protein TNCT_361661 [Trichonephila clavata]
MFDLQRIQTVVVERYFRLLRGYNRPDLLQRFMQRWMDLLSMYSSQAKFVSFDPPTPILERLVLMAVGVLVYWRMAFSQYHHTSRFKTY